MLELSVFNTLCQPNLLRPEIHVLILCKFIHKNYRYPNQKNLRNNFKFQKKLQGHLAQAYTSQLATTLQKFI